MGITSKRGRVNLLYIIKFLSNYNLLIQSSYKKKTVPRFISTRGKVLILVSYECPMEPLLWQIFWIFGGICWRFNVLKISSTIIQEILSLSNFKQSSPNGRAFVSKLTSCNVAWEWTASIRELNTVSDNTSGELLSSPERRHLTQKAYRSEVIWSVLYCNHLWCGLQTAFVLQVIRSTSYGTNYGVPFSTVIDLHFMF